MDLDTLSTELERCLIGWRVYEKYLMKQGLPGPLKATAAGWKVTGLEEFQKAVHDLLPFSEQAHVGTVNDRLIGSFVLKESLKSENIKIIKILQRRPGADDPLGLDHIDFYAADIAQAKKILENVKANWEEQSNDVHSWLSVRFGEVLEYEAKFVDHNVLDAALIEMRRAKDLI